MARASGCGNFFSGVRARVRATRPTRLRSTARARPSLVGLKLGLVGLGLGLELRLGLLCLVCLSLVGLLHLGKENFFR